MSVERVIRLGSSRDNSTTTITYNVPNRLITWAVTVPAGSALQARTYTYAYDGNSNRTLIVADAITSTLSYNAANEWTQTVATGQSSPNTIFWDAAGNLIHNDDFGTNVHPLAITYNAKNQLASITDTQQNVVPMTYSGPGESERVSAGWSSSNVLTPNGAATYTYGSGTLSRTDGAGTTSYTRDPSGQLIALRPASATSNDYYVFDGMGSVIKLVDKNGNVRATYDYCPTGNDAEPIFGPDAGLNDYRFLGEYYNPANQMYYDAWGYTDSNSGVTIQLCPVAILDGLLLPCLAPLPTKLPPGSDEACAQACTEEMYTCLAEADTLGIGRPTSGCYGAEAQCEANGGVFINPGWRQGLGYPPRQRVWP